MHDDLQRVCPFRIEKDIRNRKCREISPRDLSFGLRSKSEWLGAADRAVALANLDIAIAQFGKPSLRRLGQRLVTLDRVHFTRDPERDDVGLRNRLPLLDRKGLSS